ncbi:MAG: ribosome-associated translation inhibitor RaiA [Planctomycetota bacterium]
MQIEISYRDIDKSDAIEARVHESVEKAVGRFSERVTRIEVHLGDHNAHKKGPDDKRCMIEARPAGADPLVAEAHDEDLYKAIGQASDKIRSVLTRHFERQADRG